MSNQIIIVRVPFYLNEEGTWVPWYQWAQPYKPRYTKGEILHDGQFNHEHPLCWDKIKGMILIIPDPDGCDTLASPYGIIELTKEELTRMQETGVNPYEYV